VCVGLNFNPYTARRKKGDCTVGDISKGRMNKQSKNQLNAFRVDYNLASRILATRNPINARGVSSFLNL